jgi:hypothetical protein
VSCELTNLPTTQDLENAQVTLSENSNAQLNVIKVFENVNNYGFNTDGLKSTFSEGPAYSWSNLTLTLDFSDVPGASGFINVAFSSVPGYNAGLTATITFDAYENDGTGIEGTMMLKVEEFVANQLAKFSLNSQGNLSITEGSVTYLWSCEETIDWFQGLNTLGDDVDDEFMVNGTATQLMDTLTNKLTLNDIVNATACEYIKDGELILVHNSGSDDELEIKCNFGVDANGDDMGECDKYVEMNAGGITLSVELD